MKIIIFHKKTIEAYKKRWFKKKLFNLSIIKIQLIVFSKKIIIKKSFYFLEKKKLKSFYFFVTNLHFRGFSYFIFYASALLRSFRVNSLFPYLYVRLFYRRLPFTPQIRISKRVFVYAYVCVRAFVCVIDICIRE